MDQERLDELFQMRTEALAELDTVKFTTFCRELGFPIPPSDEIALAGMHKARLMLPEISEAGKQISRDWLTEQGFKHDISIGGAILKNDVGGLSA